MRLGLIANTERGAQTPGIFYSYDQKASVLGRSTLNGTGCLRSARRGSVAVIAPKGRLRFSNLSPWRGAGRLPAQSFGRFRCDRCRSGLTANHMMIGFNGTKGSRAGARMSNNYHSATVEWLGSWIASGKVQPGEALKVEAGLCEELGVSRTVVREAIKTLVAKGMLDVGPKVGTRVTPVRSWNLFDVQVVRWLAENGLPESFVMDLLDLRRTIEPTAVRWACERATPKQIAEIQAAYQMLAASLGDKDEYNRADKLFHEAVLAASHNQFIERMVPALGALLAVSFEVSSTVPDELGLTLPLHRDIADAIASRDVARGVWACMTLIERAALTISRHYPELVVLRGEQTAP